MFWYVKYGRVIVYYCEKLGETARLKKCVENKLRRNSGELL